MDLPIRHIAAIILVLMVVLGLLAAATDMFRNSGSDILDESDQQQRNLDCIFENKDDTSGCVDETSVEVTPDVWKG